MGKTALWEYQSQWLKRKSGKFLRVRQISPSGIRLQLLLIVLSIKTKKEKNPDLGRARNHARNARKSLNRVSAKRAARGQNQSASDRAPRQKTRKKLANVQNLVIRIK